MRLLCVFRLVLHLSLIALAFMSSLSFASQKAISIEWDAREHAVSYDLEILDSKDKTIQRNTEATSWRGELSFGVFLYRVRSRDRVKRAGEWSQWRPVVVMPEPPQLELPKRGHKFEHYSEGLEVGLQWGRIQGLDAYLLRLEGGRGARQDFRVQGSRFSIKDLESGQYRWRVLPLIERPENFKDLIETERWLGESSAEGRFELHRARLEFPQPIFPIVAHPPTTNGVLTFRWRGVSGAKGYEVVVYRLDPQAQDRKEIFKKRIQQTQTDVPVSREADYEWEVRALANFDSEGNARSVGEPGKASFRLDRNAMFRDGAGYIALSVLNSKYEYRSASPYSGFGGRTEAWAGTVRGSGEYWFHPNWSYGLGLENIRYRIGGETINRLNLDVALKTRKSISTSRFGWLFAPKAGFEMRQYFFLQPDLSSFANRGSLSGGPVGIELQGITVTGPSVGFDLRRQLNEKWSVGGKFAYFLPVYARGSDFDKLIYNSTSLRNLNVGLQGAYWLGGSWAIALGGFFDLRSISFQIQDGPSEPEEVFTDALYFFGSLIYSFGGN
jgi:hypothetical protein